MPTAVSEQLKAWCAALAEEVSTWPEVECRSFFGFTGLYRNKMMFAVLPRTRSLETTNALAFRFDSPTANLRERLDKDSRIDFAEIKQARWFSSQLTSDADLHDALGWLAKACEAAKGVKKSKKRW